MRKGNLRVWLAAASVGALLPFAQVLAADLPVKALPPAPAFVDWTGVYVGAHVGYGGGMKDWISEAGFDFPAGGFLGGGQVGINKQIASFVFGLELDGSWANISGSQTLTASGSLLGPFQESVTANSRIDGLVTFAGRAGLAADRWFVFAKGGVAGAWEKHAFNGLATGLPGTDTESVSGSEFRWAPMVGFGAEYALGGNWSMLAEYNYMHFGTRTVTLRGTDTFAGVTTPVAFDQPISQDSIHVIKVGANYRWAGISADPTYPPVRAAAGTNWTGAFVGAQGGYGFGRTQWPDFVGSSVLDDGRFDASGWLAGFDGGVNVQSGAFVFGVEGEWMWTGIKGGKSIAVSLLPGPETVTFNLNTSIDWLAIASARAGFVVGDRLLVYGKGGLAIANEKHSGLLTEVIPGFGSQVAMFDAKAIHSGVVGGVGAEYALGGNWSIKGEYDYIRMIGQNSTGGLTEVLNVPPTVAQANVFLQLDKMRQDLNLFKLGVNYHFNPMPAAVTARY